MAEKPTNEDSQPTVRKRGEVSVERKQTGNQLQQSESKYRALLETLNEGIWVIDKDDYTTYANPYMAEILGYTVDEMQGRHLFSFMDESGVEICKGLLAHRAQGIKEEHPFQFLRKDGTRVYVHITTSPLTDAQGNYSGAIAVVRDITAQKHTELALRTTQLQQKAILDNIEDIAWLKDKESRFIAVNEAFGKACGVKPEDLVGKTDLDVWPAELAKRYRADDREVIRSGRRKQVEEPLVDKNGGKTWIETIKTPIYNDHGEIVGTTGVARDITGRKQTEEALRIRDWAIKSSINAIGLADLKGKVTYVNPCFLELWGYADEKEVLGQSVGAFWQMPDNAAEIVKKLHDLGNWTGELRAKRKDGVLFDVQLSATVVRDEAGKPVCMMASFIDITERKKMEEELLRAQKLESIGILAGGIAHDFNNLLTAILGNINLAKLYAKREDKVFAKMVDAEKASLRAKDLTQQLLTFARGGRPIKKTTSITRLIRDSVGFASGGSSVRCVFSIADDLWPAEVDEEQIAQVINNLVINACQAMPSGGVIEVSAENVTKDQTAGIPLAGERYVHIALKDHGAGIPKENLSKIFDPYFTTKDTGSGLGLATTHSIIKDHEGCVTVRSEVGVGTTFHIYLPASSKATASISESLEQGAADTLSGKGRILVMDDEEMVREIAGEMLSHLGYDIEFACDGAEAIELYQKAKEAERPFKAVIMDLTIPGGMGGKEAVKRLLEIDPGLTAIVSSGYSTDPIMSDFEKYGFRGVIAKPYSIEQLSKVLQDLIGK